MGAAGGKVMPSGVLYTIDYITLILLISGHAKNLTRLLIAKLGVKSESS